MAAEGRWRGLIEPSGEGVRCLACNKVFPFIGTHLTRLHGFPSRLPLAKRLLLLGLPAGTRLASTAWRAVHELEMLTPERARQRKQWRHKLHPVQPRRAGDTYARLTPSTRQLDNWRAAIAASCVATRHRAAARDAAWRPRVLAAVITCEWCQFTTVTRRTIRQRRHVSDVTWARFCSRRCARLDHVARQHRQAFARLDPTAPGNVQWTTVRERSRDGRPYRLLTYNGDTLTLTAWARRTGLRANVIHYRLKRGWPVAAALTVPLRPADAPATQGAAGR